MTAKGRSAPDDLSAYRRPPEQVMRLARMGSSHPTRLSFLRAVLRRMQAENWQFDRPVWQMDAKGVGRAVYRAIGPERTYSLVAFAHDLPDHMRSDRVIATAWDATFALFDGTPDADDLDRLAANVPLQEAGRVTARELSLSRANRSVRLFQHVVDRLSAGQQPDAAEIDAVGYLMRTTAVYGSGKFGAADRAVIANRPELCGPFRAEMLSVWLTRAFTVDLVEHIAVARGGAKAVRLDKGLRRRLGVGNSTGLGMAPFLVRHPTLVNNWILAREEALARVRAQRSITPENVAGLHEALTLAQDNAATWHSEHPVQLSKLADLRRDLARIATELETFPRGDRPWNRLWLWAEANLSLEGQEALLAMMLEPHGSLIDDLAETMAADEAAAFTLDGSVSVGEFRAALAAGYGWALGFDYAAVEEIARFWYVSEEKLEPRIGDRFAEDGATLEQPLGIGRLAKNLSRALAVWPDEQPLSVFLLAHPEHRLMARRVQQAAACPYAEIQDNLLAADMLPIDILRCKLAFFGASHFDPRSDKWVRISLFKGEPYPDELEFHAGLTAMTTPPESPSTPATTVIQQGMSLLSRNETESLGMKAARGAGFAWGLAEEAGFAAGWLAAEGIDGASPLLALLNWKQDQPIDEGRPEPAPGHWRSADQGALCPITTGAALIDSALIADGPFRQELRLDPLTAPVLLLPFLARAAQHCRMSLRIAWSGGDLLVTPDGGLDRTTAAELAGHDELALTVRPDRPPVSRKSDPASLPPISTSVLDALAALALRTTVPATDASRRGAGSATADND